jgi:Sigma-70 region 2
LEDRLLFLPVFEKGSEIRTMATALMTNTEAGRSKWLGGRPDRFSPPSGQRSFPDDCRRTMRGSRENLAAARAARRQISASERNRLLLAHLPQVRSIASRMRDRLPPQIAAEDLYQAGVVGLIEAVDRYEPRKRAGFPTFAQFRIRGAILDSLRGNDWSPRRLRRGDSKGKRRGCARDWAGPRTSSKRLARWG